MAKELRLGNLEARRDWGYAGDDVIATGETHSVQELVEVAFGIAGLDWQAHVLTDPKLLRPAEVGLRRTIEWYRRQSTKKGGSHD